MKATAADVALVVADQVTSFAELLGVLHALRFTGAVTLHVLNGQPQTAELGRPVVVAFPEHPANKKCAGHAPSVRNSVDTDPAIAASSAP